MILLRVIALQVFHSVISLLEFFCRLFSFDMYEEEIDDRDSDGYYIDEADIGLR
jgi:hypothetical protein